MPDFQSLHTLQEQNFEAPKADNKMEQLKEKVNQLINNLYDDVAQHCFSLDNFIMPAHGISTPELENPMNLFKRQLKLEELSFELAHKKYQKSLNDLIKIGRADQLATSHRYILSWIKAMESSITEQQKIYVKRGNLDPQKNKLGYYLIQMPSDKIAAVCVIHMMKHLFSQFVKDVKTFDDEFSLLKTDKKQTEFLLEQDSKIPSLQLF